MKYIKQFESKLKYLYKEGDYIILSHKVLADQELYDSFENIGIIISQINDTPNFKKYLVDYLIEDLLEFEDIPDYIYETDIVRKLSKKEIDDLNIKIEAKKYNL